MKRSKTLILFFLLYTSLNACVATDVNTSAVSVGPLTKNDIIFETDFSQDAGYFATQEELINSSNVPKGWDGVKVSGNGSFQVLTDPAIANKPVLKITWDPKTSQPTNRLMKHLTGNLDTGFEELYIRYNIRLPRNFKVGNGKKINHWKWGRLWQNTAPRNPGAGNRGAWTENRADSFYVVWNFTGNPPYTKINSTWGANTGAKLKKSSSGGERYSLDYFISGSNPESQAGYFENVGNGAWDFFTSKESAENAGFLKNKNQKWHTIEYRFKLATSPTANDGIQQVWMDGVLQNANGAGKPGWTRIRAKGGAPDLSGIPTSKNGSGFNMFVLFDNMQSWNADWDEPGVEGFVYLNDVVVSRNRIGHEYKTGSL